MLGFNSTLVQLKAMLFKVLKHAKNKFQFYLSSIKSNRFGFQFFSSSMFQFYLSSIKSYLDIKAVRNFD